jgi:calcium-independent phospholipase A2-gamma
MDGGGIRGLFTLDVLRALEAATGRPVRESFDLIVGTSTGAFIAGCLAAGKTLDEIEEEYWKVSVSFIAAKPSIWAIISRLISGHVIDPAVIYGLLCGFLGDVTMEQLPASPRLLLVATDGSSSVPQPYLVRNRPLEGAQAARSAFPHTTQCTVADALRASTAAPTFYPSHQLSGKTIVDGAIHNNNPVIFALAEAAVLAPDQPIEILLSVGTGNNSPEPHYEGERGMLSWIATLLNRVTEVETPHLLAASLLGPGRYVRWNPAGVGDCYTWEADRELLYLLRERVKAYMVERSDEVVAVAARLAVVRSKVDSPV